MKRIIIGTAGHIDHGKSSLVKALTGIDPDRLKEEKERGITIDLGFAHLDLPGSIRAGIVDVPGHEKFVRNMVAGAYGIDLLLLVVAADEGIMPQTREHLDICELLGVEKGVVALTKRDLVEEEWLEMVAEDVREFLGNYSLSGSPIVPVSAVTGEGLNELREALASVAREVRGKESNSLLLLPIDRVFPVRGTGTVVTGTLFSGRISVGEELVVLPGGVSCRVRGLQSHGQFVDEALAGMRVAVNLSGVEREQVFRGCALTRRGEAVETLQLDAYVTNLTVNRRPYFYGERVTFHCGTARAGARLFPYGKEEIPPGKSGFVRVRLEEPAVLLGGNRFILRGFARLENFGYTTGGGIVLNPSPPKRSPARWEGLKEVFEALLRGNEEEKAWAALVESGPSGCSVVDVSRITGMPPAAARRALESLERSGEILPSSDGRFYLASLVEEAADELEKRFKALHDMDPLREGFSLEEAASGIKWGGTGVLDRAVALLLEEGRLVRGEGGLLPRDRKCLEDDLLNIVEKTISDRGIEGPTPSEIADITGVPERDVRAVLSKLQKMGRVKRSRDHYFTSEVLERIVGEVRKFLEEHGEMTVSQFRDLVGTTRKYAVPLIELLDQERVTIRRGDVRVLWKK